MIRLRPSTPEGVSCGHVCECFVSTSVFTEALLYSLETEWKFYYLHVLSAQRGGGVSFNFLYSGTPMSFGPHLALSQRRAELVVFLYLWLSVYLRMGTHSE